MRITKTFILFCFFILFIHHTQGVVQGIISGLQSKCGSNCSWSDPTIWSTGTVPVATDTVDIQQTGTYTIKVDADVTVSDFDIGTSTYSDGKVTFEILSGFTFHSTGQVNADITSTIIVDANASLISDGQSTNYGALTINNGFASFGGSSPSLQMNTRDKQISTNIVYARLTLNSAILNLTNGLTITGQSSLYGNGTINGGVTLRGTLQPGGESSVGTLHISQDLIIDSSDLIFTPTIYIDIASATSYDHIIIGQTCSERGTLLANLISNYEPLSHSEFFCFNHTQLRLGFETVRGTSLLERLSTKWQTVPDQSYTSLLYDDATTLLISFSSIFVALMFTLL